VGIQRCVEHFVGAVGFGAVRTTPSMVSVSMAGTFKAIVRGVFTVRAVYRSACVIDAVQAYARAAAIGHPMFRKGRYAAANTKLGPRESEKAAKA
jgi:hypothetical protein